MNQQQMTTDQFRDAAKMVPTDCCNSAPEKRLADGIRYWDCAKCGATVWIENPIKDHTEQHLDMVSYTPRTDSETYVWQNGEENPFVQKEFARQLERELAASKAEVAKLNHQLIKTESDLLQSQDINSFLDTEFRIACKRAERAEAEVERLDHLLADASETNHKLAAEVERLKEELELAVYGCGCDNYLQIYCDKHNPYNKTK
jgi:predicted RNase H-like nuclease (RuvC/YqgF family)